MIIYIQHWHHLQEGQHRDGKVVRSASGRQNRVAGWFMSAQSLPEHSVVPQPPVVEKNRTDSSCLSLTLVLLPHSDSEHTPPNSNGNQWLVFLNMWQEEVPFSAAQPFPGLHTQLCCYYNSVACLAINKSLSSNSVDCSYPALTHSEWGPGVLIKHCRPHNKVTAGAEECKVNKAIHQHLVV